METTLAAAPSRRTRRRGRRRWPLILGTICIVLALIGLITLLVLGVQGLMGLFNNDEEKAAVEEFVTPMVMMDPPQFESVSELDSAIATEIALRAVLIENSDSTTFLTDDSGRMIVPFSEVQKKGETIFGEDIALVPLTIGDGESSFEYVEVEDSYHIPALAQTGYYIPKVLELSGMGSKLVARIGYVPANEMTWSRNEQGEAVMPDPVKYMKYTLEKKDGGYILTAIEPDEKAPEVKVAAASSESAPSGSEAEIGTGESPAAESIGTQSEAA
ncbi:MAG: hypothetical protein HFE85_03555 [Clostridiales bacterium]|nr:hypothetical protein [Clostridiales bacterium]